jgi:hypothetical protein
MKIKALVIVLMGLLSFSRLNAQGKFYTAFEFMATKDKAVTSYSNRIKGPDLSYIEAPAVSLLLGYEVFNWLHLETGLISKSFYDGYSTSKHAGGYTSGNRIQIPIRIKSNIAIIKRKLFLQPSVAYHYGESGEIIQPLTEFSYGSQGNSSGYNENVSAFRQVYTNIYDLVEAGLGLNYSIDKRWSVYGNFALLMGQQTISRHNVQYENSNGVSESNTVINNGSYNAFTFGLKMNLGKSKNQKV